MFTRRKLLASGTVGGAMLLFPARSLGASPVTSPLPPASIPKYVGELPIPAAMPHAGHRNGITSYEIAVRQVRRQVLPSSLPPTTVWAFGSAAHPGTFGYPGNTINAMVDRPVRVTWINQLTDPGGGFLPPLLPVDQTLHWAYPPGGLTGRDSMPTFPSTPGPYTGPMPIVTHLHGGHTFEESDGYPEAWFLPTARNIPREFARVGSYYDRFREEAEERYGVRWRPGSSTYQYANDQPAATLWYHDHALGVTRVNVYAGLAGFYLLRGGEGDLPDGVLPGPAPALGDPPGKRHYEIPIVIQDRSFNADGSFFFPASRAFAGYAGPYVPDTDVPPIWNPEFLADAIVVNGRTWPVLPVEQRRYRFRFLNGSGDRFLFLKIAADPVRRPAAAALPIWQIGGDGGFLPAPVRSERLLIAPANRFDTVVDFGDVPVGTELWLVNEGPDSPYQGGEPGTDFPPADPGTTGQVLKFVVRPRTGRDRSVPPDQLRLPAPLPLGPAVGTRRLLLSELDSRLPDPDASPISALLGTVAPDGTPIPLRWGDPVTEAPVRGTTEIWALRNDTPDAHPIHVHQVQFEVLGRGPDGSTPPTPAESGRLDTVIVPPGQTTRIKATFDLPGRYVWHCHMISHEDNEMMRPIQVVDKPRQA